MARKAKGSGNKSGKGKSRSAMTGRYVTKSHGKSSPSTTVKESRKGATRDAGEFADRFMERYPGTFHELSKRQLAEPETVSVEDLTRIHDRVVNSRDGASPGIRDPGALEAAVARPHGGFGGVEFFPTPFAKAAALMESVSQRHGFVDGNKRTGLLAAALLLGRAGYDLEFPEEESVGVTVEVAEHRLDVDDLARWLEDHAVAFDEEEQPRSSYYRHIRFSEGRGSSPPPEWAATGRDQDDDRNTDRPELVELLRTQVEDLRADRDAWREQARRSDHLHGLSVERTRELEGRLSELEPAGFS